MSAVEDVATAIAATVRANGWKAKIGGLSKSDIYLRENEVGRVFCVLCCDDAIEAKRLAAMMRGKA